MATNTTNNNSSEVTIRPLTEADIPACIETIQKAFADNDPFFQWVYHTEAFSSTRNHVSLGIRLRWGLNTGCFKTFVADTTDRSCAGVAIWLPPRAEPSWWQGWHLWFQQLGMNAVYGRGGLRANRYWIWKESQQKLQEEIWTDKEGYWFLNILATHPDSQGKGIGRKLMEEVYQVADRQGRQCYLESSKLVPNVKIYEKLGFRLVKEMDCVDEGDVCKLFCMLRDPVTVDEN